MVVTAAENEVIVLATLKEIIRFLEALDMEAANLLIHSLTDSFYGASDFTYVHT